MTPQYIKVRPVEWKPILSEWFERSIYGSLSRPVTPPLKKDNELELIKSSPSEQEEK